jgi:hypothetical protein
MQSKSVPLPSCRNQEWEEVYLLPNHDLGTRWGWVVDVTPRPSFYPREWTTGTNWIEGRVGLRAGMDKQARGNFLCPYRGPNPGGPVCSSQALYWLSYPSSLTTRAEAVNSLPSVITSRCPVSVSFASFSSPLLPLHLTLVSEHG